MNKNKLKTVSDAEYIYTFYSTGLLRKRIPKNENILSKDSVFAYKYARYYLRGRFELGEEEISKNVEYSYYYAVNVIGDKLPEKMHNKMLGHALDDPENKFVKKYFELLKAIDNQKSSVTNDY